ncbi:MAG: hypothetical protein L3K26_18035 [Candidatus Hydrogenedentes bacterium]|nr:hypothetical protein [Candidatus Hydrogenedentota bacterium]
MYESTDRLFYDYPCEKGGVLGAGVVQGNRSGLTVLKVIVAVVILGVLLAVLRPALTGSEFHCGRPSTQNTMKQWGLVFKMYANESEGERFPVLADVPGVWAPDLAEVYPEYLTDPALLVAAEHPEATHLIGVAQTALGKELLDYSFAAKVMGESFAYLSHIALNESDVMTLAKERRAGRLGRDNTEAILEGKRRIIPLREASGSACFGPVVLETTPWVGAQSELPVLIEIARWKQQDARKTFKGANVLYMDGHVEFVPLGTFPVVPSVMNVLSGLAP